MNTIEFIEKSKLIFGDKYDYSKSVYINNRTKIEIIYDGVSYFQRPSDHLIGRKSEINHNIFSFIKKSKEIHNGKYDYSKVVYKNNNTKVIIMCKEHGEFQQVPRNHTSGIGCEKCSRGTLTIDEFVKLSNEIFNFKYDYSLVDNLNNTKKVKIICKEHGEFEMTPKIHLYRKNGCSKCSGNRRLTTVEFIEMSKKKYVKYNFNYEKTNYFNLKTDVIVTCGKHGDFITNPNLHLYGNSHCNLCADRVIWNFEYFETESNKIHGNKYKYDKGTFKNSSIKTIITCDKHGDFWQRPDSHIQGVGCPTCKSSKGELVVEKYLIENKIKYEKQKRFRECVNILELPFDFYISDKNTCIEFDGIQHFEPRERFGGIDGFNSTRMRDDIKNKWCLNNGVNLIRISDIKDVENKLKHLNG